jgi:NitT/TauT family transport system permease protein
MSKTERNYSYYILRYSGVILFLALWQILPMIGIVNSQFIPPLSEVLVQVYSLWVYNALFTSIMVSLWRVVIGLIIASIIAIPVGFILGGWFNNFADVLDPLFRIFGQVNPVSLMPIFILFFGMGEIAKLAVVAWVCLWPVLYNTILGAKSVDKLLIKTAFSMKVSNWQMFKKVLLPASEPFIFAGLRVGVEMAFFMLIAVEMLGASAGLGVIYHTSAMNNQIPRMYAAGIFVVVLGVALNRSLIYIQNKLFFWKEPDRIFSFAKWKKESTKFGRVQIKILTIIIVIIIGIGSYEVHFSNSSDFTGRYNTITDHMNMKDMNMDMENDNKNNSSHTDNKNQNKNSTDTDHMDMGSDHMNMKK